MIARIVSVVVGSALGLSCACATPSSSSSSSSSLSSSLAAQAQPAQPVSLVWAWPAGSEATVEETVQKKGNTVVQRYRLRLLPVEGDAALNDVVLDDLHVIAVNGKAVDPQANADIVSDAERLGALLPRTRIDATGTLVDVVGLDELIAAAVGTAPEAERAQLLKFMTSPAAQPLMRAAGEKIWNTWVGGLVGLQAPPGEDLVAVTTVNGPDGPLEQETHFVLREAGDHVVVDTSTTTPPPVARALLMPIVKPLVDSLAGKNSADVTAFLDAMEWSMMSSTSTELEPATMRPHRAQSRQTIRVGMAGNIKEHVEQHDYVFTWK